MHLKWTIRTVAGGAILCLVILFIPLRRAGEVIVDPQFGIWRDTQVGATSLPEVIRLQVFTFDCNPPETSLIDPIVFGCNYLPEEWVEQLKRSQTAFLRSYAGWGRERLADFNHSGSYDDRLMANQNLPLPALVLLIQDREIVGCGGSFPPRSLFRRVFRSTPEYHRLKRHIRVESLGVYKGEQDAVIVPDLYRYYLFSDDPAAGIMTPEVRSTEHAKAGWRFYYLVENPFLYSTP